MAEPYIGQMIPFAGNFAIRGWAKCDGQLLPISQWSALFSILGTTYGGDGRVTFGLPECRGRAVIHEGNGPGLPDYRLGQKSGNYQHQLTISQMPSHNHVAVSSSKLEVNSAAGSTSDPEGAVPAAASEDIYSDLASTYGLDNGVATSTTIGNTGGGQAYNIMNPYIAVNWLIALQGQYPPRS